MKIQAIQKSFKYLIFIYIIIIAIITPVQINSDRTLAYFSPIRIVYILTAIFMLYLLVCLKKCARAEFSTFLNAIIVTIIFYALSILYVSLFNVQPLYNLTYEEYVFSVHGNIVRGESFVFIVSLYFLTIIGTSRRVKTDSLVVLLAILISVITVSIGVLDLFGPMRREISISDLALLYPVMYFSVFIYLFFSTYLKRISVNKGIFRLLFLCVILSVGWSSLLVVNFLWFNIQISLNYLDSIRVLSILVFCYSSSFIVTNRKEISYVETPVIERAYLYYFMVFFIIVSIITKNELTPTQYFFIGTIASIVLFTIRLIYLKDVEEQTKELLLEKQRKLMKIVHYSELTHLANRRKFIDDAEELIKKGIPFAILVIDMDKFKNINDLLSHKHGDALLIELAKYFQAIIQSNQTVYHLSGDEFSVLIKNPQSEEVIQLCKQILDIQSSPFEIYKEVIQVSLSIGVVAYPVNGTTLDDLLKYVDTALHEAKTYLENKSCFFSEALYESIEKKLNTEREILAGIERNEFELFYQPQYTVNYKLIGFEALIRWNHPERGRVSPFEFITIAEETGTIVALGAWVLKTACLQLAEWMEISNEELKMSVNVSVRQLQQANFVETVKNIIRSANVPAKQLMLEITETYPFYEEKEVVDRMEELHNFGCRLAIDDFGTGFCSLTSLTKVHIDQIKIAREYTIAVGVHEQEETLLRHILNISRELKLQTIAEGVETREQLHAMKKMGCELIQGYYFSPPVDKKKATEMISV